MHVCTSLQTDNHANTPALSFLQAGCPSCRPTNSVKALKAILAFSQHNKEWGISGMQLTFSTAFNNWRSSDVTFRSQ